MNNKKVSVIVTCYNLADRIGTCLDSLLAQTYADLEILVIDDGSRDGSDAVILEYAKKDPRIRPVLQENTGVSGARNHCLDLFTGEYLLFIDGDDYVSLDYVERFMEQAQGCDVVIGGLCFVYSDGAKQAINQFPFRCGKQEYLEKYYSQTVALRTIFGPVNKLFNSQIIRDHHIRFEEGLEIREDGIFVLEFLRYAETFCGIDHTGYFYIQNGSGSSLVSKFHAGESAINRRFFRLLVDFKGELTDADVARIYPMYLNMEISSVRKLYCSKFYSLKAGLSYIRRILKEKEFRAARREYRRVAGKKALKYYRPALLVHIINYLAAQKIGRRK